MTRVPLLGRLLWREYLALLGSLILVALEVIVRIITLGLPRPVIRFCYNASRRVFNRFDSAKSQRARAERRSISHAVATCSDFTDLCALYGYYAEEHIVQTTDGYLLGVHRLPFRKEEEPGTTLVNAGPGSVSKPVVYLHHGLLMNSEVWVCITEEERCLPFALVSQGYDVWLGNNRGNKYSKKSTHFSPTSPKFWDFSIDEFAFHDIPDTIAYILNATGQPSLSYIGFSQGTAQAFATLSIHPALNQKVNVFIALAPAMSPAGLSNGIVDALVKASPEVLFLTFGRKSVLSSATMWQSILYPPIFVRLIDYSLAFLFAWYGRNISTHQKLAAYPHLYSFTSTKSVVHWFQIIRNKSFQMYDDEASSALSIGASNRYYKVAKFPTRNIKTPIVLVYGGSDSLVDIRVMLKELPRHTIATEIPHFEHLDFLWAQEVDKLVFPHVFEALKYFSGTSHANGIIPRGLAQSSATTARLRNRRGSGKTAWSEDESSSSDFDSSNSAFNPLGKSFAQQQRDKLYLERPITTPTPVSPGSASWAEQSLRRPTLDSIETPSRAAVADAATASVPSSTPPSVATASLPAVPVTPSSTPPSATTTATTATAVTSATSPSPQTTADSKLSDTESTRGSLASSTIKARVVTAARPDSPRNGTGSRHSSPAPVVKPKGITVGVSRPSLSVASTSTATP